MGERTSGLTMADEERLLLALDDTSRTGVRVAGLRIAAAGLGFVASIAIARGLGATGRGLVALPVAVLGIVMALSHVGLEGSNVFLAGQGVPLRRLWAADTVAAVLASTFAFGCVVVVGAVVGPEFVGGLPTSWIVVAVGQLPIVLMSFYWTSVLQLDDALTAAVTATVVGSLASAIAVLLLAVAGEMTAFRVLALGWVTTGTTWALLLRIGVRRGVAGLRTDRTLLVHAISFGLRAQLATAFTFLLLRVDQVLVQRTLGFEALGVYAVTVVVAELLWLVADPFAASLLPHQVRAADGDERRLGYATARIGFTVAALLGGIAWVVAPYAIRLAYGEEFVPATWPVRWLVVGVAAVAAQRPLYAIVTKEGRMWLAAALNAGALAINVALNLVLLPAVGIVGAAIASSVTYVLLGAGYVVATRRPGVADWSDLVPRRDDLARLVSGARRAMGTSPPSPQTSPPARRPSPRPPERQTAVEGCPLCGGSSATPAASIPYDAIWEGLRTQWNARLPDDLIRRLERGPTAGLVRCAVCGLEYFAGAFAGDAEFYERLMANTPYHGDRWEFGVVISRIPLGGSVADLGCGDGAFVRAAAGRAGRVVGVDHNPDAVGRLRGAGFEAVGETFDAFAEREPGAFDVVCSFHTLEHLPDARAAASAARALLRPGGRFFVSVPNRDRFGRRDDEPLDCPPHHVSRWSAQQLAELAERSGFALQSVTFEHPDLSHVREEAIERSRLLRRTGARGDRGIVSRVWMRAAVGPRRYRRALARGDYRDRGIMGHSMLGELAAREP